MADETKGTDPQLAEDVDVADPAQAERLLRGSWPATDEELRERAGVEPDEDEGPAEPEVGGG